MTLVIKYSPAFSCLKNWNMHKKDINVVICLHHTIFQAGFNKERSTVEISHAVKKCKDIIRGISEHHVL